MTTYESFEVTVLCKNWLLVDSGSWNCVDCDETMLGPALPSQGTCRQMSFVEHLATSDSSSLCRAAFEYAHNCLFVTWRLCLLLPDTTYVGAPVLWKPGSACLCRVTWAVRRRLVILHSCTLQRDSPALFAGCYLAAILLYYRRAWRRAWGAHCCWRFLLRSLNIWPIRMVTRPSRWRRWVTWRGSGGRWSGRGCMMNTTTLRLRWEVGIDGWLDWFALSTW